jgi:predicted nucleic acid-binding protein
VITLDTSGVYALCNRADPDHVRARQVLLTDRGPHIVPVGILAEVCYLLEERLGVPVLLAFLVDLEQGVYLPDCGDKDLPRIAQLVERYSDLPLGFADAAVISCAERRGGAVLTFDERHFRVVERAGSIRVLP